jgi:hypothetical protein
MTQEQGDAELREKYASDKRYLVDPDGLVHARDRRSLRTRCEEVLEQLVWPIYDLEPCDGPISCFRCAAAGPKG